MINYSIHIIVNNNQINENGKKFNKNAIKKIKKVICRLNDFLGDERTKNIYSKTNYLKGKKYLINDYDYILKNVKKFLKEKSNNKSKKSTSKKAKIKDNEVLTNRKQIPINTRNYKKISMNEIKKLINHSQNSIYLNKHKLNKSNDNIKLESSSKEKKPLKILIKNYSGYINKNKPKVYKFTEEQLNKYKEIFNYLFDYIKLFFQKFLFNIIILYVNIKNKYICGFNRLVTFFKKAPFNYLRIIQQRAYYEVILRQFYLPYIVRAFNNIHQYIMYKQKFVNAVNIIKEVYFLIFIKRLLFFIEVKENYIKKYEYEKIIEEEKDDISDSNENKSSKTNINNNTFKNNIKSNSSINSNNYENNNEIKEIDNELNIKENRIRNQYRNNESINKDISESYDEIKIITKTFNTIINNISISPKIYVFDLFKQYYQDSKNKNINNIENDNINNNKDNKIEVIDKSNNKIDYKNKNFINDNKYKTYVYESLSEQSSFFAFANSEGNGKLHKVYSLLEQNKTKDINNNSELDKNKIQNIINDYRIEELDHKDHYINEINNEEENEELLEDFNNLSLNDSEEESHLEVVKKKK